MKMAIEYDELHEYTNYNCDIDIKLEDFVVQTGHFLDSKAGISSISDHNLAQDVLLKNIKVENSNEVLSTDTGNTESCEFGLDRIETIKIEECVKIENMPLLQEDPLSEYNQTHINLEANKELSSRGHSTHSIQRRKDSDTVFCKECNKMISYYYYYRIHANIHAGNTPYKCDICKKRFVKLSFLDIHKVTHSERKPYSCKSCERSFKRKADFKRHQSVHSSKRPFPCDQCDKRFKDNASLKVHKETHVSRAVRYGESFKTRPQHTKGVDLVNFVHLCSYCGKTFSQKRSMMNHIRLHTAPKPFTCEVCKKQFTFNSLLQTHMIVHSGDHPYSCTFCPAIFPRIASLKRHMKLHIKKEVENC